MSYKESNHCKTFTTNVDEFISTINSVDSSGQGIKDLVYCSAVLLTSAQIEKFLENILSSWGSYINSKSGKIKNSKLPENLKNYKLLLKQRFLLDDFYSDKNETRFLKELGRRPELLTYANPDAKISSIDLSKVYSDRKYPSPKNFKRLFFRVGIDSVFAEMARITSQNMEDLLTSFNSVRTVIAHDGKTTGFTKVDIIRHLDNMKLFVKTLDEVSYNHVKGYTGVVSWNYIRTQPSI